MAGLAEAERPALQMGPITPVMIMEMGLWPAIEPFLIKACDYSGGRFTPRTVMEKVASGAFTLWGVADDKVRAVAVTSIADYPTGLRVMEILLTAGEESRAWLHFEKSLREVAKDRGCSKVQIVGRRGWARTLGAEWTEVARMLEVNI